MKKIITLLLAVVFCRITLAQPHTLTNINDTALNRQLPDDMISWGIKVGWNYTNLYGKEIDYIFENKNTEFQSGFNTGLFVDTRMSKRLGLKHELLFSQNHIGTFRKDKEYGDYKSKLTMSYLSLMPAGLTFYQGGFQLYAGPYLNALLNASIQRKNENGFLLKDKSIFGSPENDEAETLYLQKFDFGTYIGIEYRFDMGLSVGARYTHGFTDIFQYANSYTNGDTKTNNINIYNHSWVVSIGYALGNVKK